MMNHRLVPATLIPSVLDMAIRNRIPVESIFAQANIDPAVVGVSGTFLTLEQVIRLFDAAYAAARDPAFGLHLGESVHYHSLDLVGQAIATSRNVQEAFDELFRFKDLVAPFVNFSLETEKDSALLAFSIDTAAVKSNMHVHHEVVATMVVTIGAALSGRHLGLKELRFSHSQPAYVEEYTRVFGVPVSFGHWRNEIRFSREILAEPLLTSYPDYHQRVHHMAIEKLRFLESGLSFSLKVQIYIEKHLGTTTASLEDVAAYFSLTPRTLQRRLQSEGISFAELRDRCRHARALRDLADPHLDIDALAERLGFSDTSNFYHAFKRWQGVSPGHYRRSLGGALRDIADPE